MPPTAATASQGGRINCRAVFRMWLYFMKVLTVLSLLANIVAYCLTMKAACQSNLATMDQAFIVLAMSGYCLLCVLFILIEFYWPPWLIERVFLFTYWGGRGFALVWIGIQIIYSVKQLAAAIGASDPSVNTHTVETFGQVIGWILISTGGLYILFSIMCLRRLYSKGGDANDLEVRLLPTSDDQTHTTLTVVPPSGGTISAQATEDAAVVVNMATAFGLSGDEMRRRFAGKNGAKEAQTVIKAMTTGAGARASSAVTEMQKIAPAPSAGTAASKGSAPLPPPSSPPAADDAKQKGGVDDDELARQYYASRVQQ